MNFLVRVFLWACLLSFLSGPTSAQEVGSGPICDQADQLAQFLQTPNNQTLVAINQAAGSPACGIAAVAYFKVKEVSVVRTSKGAFTIYEIVVVAGFVNGQPKPVPPTTQYTAFPLNETRA